MYCEDSDLSKRVMAKGKSIIFYPEAAVYHNWQRDNTHNIKGVMRFMNSLIKYFNKWGWKF
jgi:GT2 family glycosyltransferase